MERRILMKIQEVVRSWKDIKGRYYWYGKKWSAKEAQRIRRREYARLLARIQDGSI